MTKQVRNINRKTVYILDEDIQIERMFTENGWYRTYRLFNDTCLPDLVVFTGGADITPAFYGEKPHPTTQYNRLRDEIEKTVFEKCLDKVPMVGICRGGQFLNVMMGGKMYQDVDKHAIHGTHPMRTMEGRVINVTSTHHQMMIPPDDKGDIIGWAELSTRKETANNVIKLDIPSLDPEVVFFKKEKVLSFQPHPEYGVRECEDYFFELLNERLCV